MKPGAGVTPSTKREIEGALAYLAEDGPDKDGAQRGMEDWFCESLFEEGFMTHILADEGGWQAFNEAAKKCGAEQEDFPPKHFTRVLTDAEMDCLNNDGKGLMYMEPKHEAHLTRIKNKFVDDVDKRYRAGNKEHGGFILDKPGLIDEALEEIVDLYVYLVSVKEQIEGTVNDTKTS